MKTLQTILAAGLSILPIVGCDNSPKIIQENENLPQVLARDLQLKSDYTRTGFRTYKVDFGEPIGSYALLEFDSKRDSYFLHFYTGNGAWMDVEGKLANDSWLRALKKDMMDKLTSGQVSTEGIAY